MKLKQFIYSFALGILLSCATIPKGFDAASPFSKEKYLGKWFEIARLDFKFEKNLNNTTAEYSMNSNGTIKVDNNGFDVKRKKWKQAIGKAKFIDSDTIAKLKVSFFGPFYSGYNVLSIDNNYSQALVSGSSTKYLWILSRKTTIPIGIKEKYLKIADSLGFPIQELVWVKHTD